MKALVAGVPAEKGASLSPFLLAAWVQLGLTLAAPATPLPQPPPLYNLPLLLHL